MRSTASFDPPSYDPKTFGFLVTDLSRMIGSEFERRIAAAGLGLTAGEARALVNAARLGPTRQAALADRMGVEPMTVSTYVDRLEARGLVTRVADPDDRRARLVRLTGAADAVLATVRGVADGIRDVAAHDIPPQDWRSLMATLAAAHENLAASRMEAARRESDAA